MGATADRLSLSLASRPRCYDATWIMDERAERRTADSGQVSVAAVMLSAREAATCLGVHERTIRRAIARGELTATKRGGTFQISRNELERYRTQRLDAPGSPTGHVAIDSIGTVRPIGAPTRLVVVGSERLAPSPLPRPLDAIVGREQELADVRELLQHAGVRLLTLTGPGGVGKTRLAVEAAAGIENHFSDGAAFVSLAATSDPAMVLPTIARALGLRELDERTIAEGLGVALRDRQLLLVIDNFEQVISSSQTLAEVLRTCPGITALTTSREPLRVGGEHRFAVQPLPIPPHVVASDTDVLSRNASVSLFLERARRVRPEFALTQENAETVAIICSRLDGLPLAIELAAAWLGTLSTADLLERLRRRLPLLTRGNRDLPDRQRTMRDAIAWSYDLLSDDERRGVRTLAVFVGGFSLEAVEFVVESPREKRTDDDFSAVHLVDALGGKSLLGNASASARAMESAPRFIMLETVREFALDRLLASGEDEAMRSRHASWCIDAGEKAWRRLWQQPLRLADLDRVETEHDNFRTALGWLIAGGNGERALHLATSLTPFWYLRSHRREGEIWLERARACCQGINPGRPSGAGGVLRGSTGRRHRGGTGIPRSGVAAVARCRRSVGNGCRAAVVDRPRRRSRPAR